MVLNLNQLAELCSMQNDNEAEFHCLRGENKELKRLLNEFMANQEKDDWETKIKILEIRDQV